MDKHKGGNYPGSSIGSIMKHFPYDKDFNLAEMRGRFRSANKNYKDGSVFSRDPTGNVVMKGGQYPVLTQVESLANIGANTKDLITGEKDRSNAAGNIIRELGGVVPGAVGSALDTVALTASLGAEGVSNIYGWAKEFLNKFKKLPAKKRTKEVEKTAQAALKIIKNNKQPNPEVILEERKPPKHERVDIPTRMRHKNYVASDLSTTAKSTSDYNYRTSEEVDKMNKNDEWLKEHNKKIEKFAKKAPKILPF